MNYLDTARRAQVIRCLIEGSSVRATSRMTNVSIPTVLKLLVDAGTVCSEYQDGAVRNLTSKRIQVDEAWSYCFSKQKNTTEEKKAEGHGDVWTWIAIDADSKLIATWMVGGRGGECAREFMCDLAGRLANRVQLTSDGHAAYLEAVEAAFGCDVDYAMLIKHFEGEGGKSADVRYSPAKVTSIEKRVITGQPDAKHISTSYVERQNLTMRMGMRRFTRLTNGFSKKAENHAHAVALHAMHYNFCRVHQTLKVTPAMQAGIADHVWEIEEVIALLDAKEKALEAEKGPRRTRGAKGTAVQT